jgi:hypothetical protein
MSMRSVSIKFKGKNVKLVASFGAARDLCDGVHDLLALFNDQQRALIFLQMGRTYQAEFKFTVEKVAQVFQIGLQHAGVDVEADDVEAFMVEIGLDKAQKIAQDYLALFFAKPKMETEAKGDGSEKK